MKAAILSIICSVIGFIATAVYAANAPVPKTDQGKEFIGFIMVCFIGLAFVSVVTLISIVSENWIKNKKDEIHGKRSKADETEKQS